LASAYIKTAANNYCTFQHFAAHLQRPPAAPLSLSAPLGNPTAHQEMVPPTMGTTGLNEACSEVLIGAHVSVEFSTQNGLKQGNALSLLLFNFG
jgi:hypothetical protein